MQIEYKNQPKTQEELQAIAEICKVAESIGTFGVKVFRKKVTFGNTNTSPVSASFNPMTKDRWFFVNLATLDVNASIEFMKSAEAEKFFTSNGA